MTAWAQLLHFYQPPTQTHDVLARIVEESYRPVLAVLKGHRQARIAININAVLTELLVNHGYHDVVDSLRELGECGQVEFVGSGRYHPILPLIPETERARSIAENARVNRSLLGKSWDTRGFFPPEMCYSSEIAPGIASSGHDWMILSGVACPGDWPTQSIYRTPANGHDLRVLFRDDLRSNRISFGETTPESFMGEIARVGGGGAAYVVTAMDVETFGHHLKGWERDFLAATYSLIESQAGSPGSGESIEMVQPSELLGRFPTVDLVEPRSSSWSTSRDDIAAHNPYPLWRAPGNELHELQWQYVEHCIALLAIARRYARSEDAKEAIGIADDRLQPALHSCQFWWASRQPMWSVPMIHRGFLMLNEVLLFAWQATLLGDASARVKDEASWRVAAAGVIRARLESILFEGGA